MTPEQRKTIEREFYNYKSSDNALWKTVFDRTLIICGSKENRKAQLNEVFKLLYIEHKRTYTICSILDMCEDDFYKRKRKIKDIALDEAQKLKLL